MSITTSRKCVTSPPPSQKVRHYNPGRIVPAKAKNGVVQLDKVKNRPIKLKCYNYTKKD